VLAFALCVATVSATLAFNSLTCCAAFAATSCAD
jgi:hypothetical protein